MQTVYLEPTQQAGAALLSRQIQGEVVMLNLLRFKTIADSSQHPQLAPADPISGRAAGIRRVKTCGGSVFDLGIGSRPSRAAGFSTKLHRPRRVLCATTR
jgi:hypothetical protein